MFYCHGGQHRFSEMSYSNLINKKGTEKEYRQTFKLIKYGLSSEQIADVLEKDPRTIEAWVTAIAKKVKGFIILFVFELASQLNFFRWMNCGLISKTKIGNFGYLLL